MELPADPDECFYSGFNGPAKMIFTGWDRNWHGY